MIINQGKGKPEQSKNMILGSSAPSTVTPDSGYTLGSVVPSIDTTAVNSSNIRKYASILGVTGSYIGTEVIMGVIKPSSTSESITITEAIGKSNIIILCCEDITIASSQSVGLFYCASGKRGQHYFKDINHPYQCLLNSVSWNSSTGKATVSYGYFSSILDYRFFAW